MLTFLLIDFGSTFTKATLVDLEREEILATAKAPTTVEKDITEGLQNALAQLPQDKIPQDKRYRQACSSAAGGLKMVAIGLIRELTAEAARLAALGAGARVLATYARELTKDDMAEIAAHKPDIIMLAGGTDGGNREVILQNAGQLTFFPYDLPVIYAGNKAAAAEAIDILRWRFQEIAVSDNVMPELNQLNIEPSRQTIREIFLEKIIRSKGLERAIDFAGSILMPTPAAVLKAAELLACGSGSEEGIGELVLVDVGGATTDVYSLAAGEPATAGVICKGLLEPFAKRTVEGDLGMRYSAPGILDATSPTKILAHSPREGLEPTEIEHYITEVHRNVHHLAIDANEKALETALAATAIEVAVGRHAGRLELFYTPQGPLYVQYGKDLTGVANLIGTGGVIVEHHCPRSILTGALHRDQESDSLCPKNPKLFLDKNYILAAMGLLSENYPEVALRIMKKNLQPL